MDLGPFVLNDDATRAIAEAHPTQAHLNALACAHRDTLERIEISEESFDPPDDLDFTDIGMLPNLVRLSLDQVSARRLHFTKKNLPALESFTAINLLSPVDLYLDLPELELLDIQHTHNDSAHNAFGASLSRCPKLRRVSTYKFRFLSGSNFCVLPECETLSMWRSECTDRLEILHAPKLQTLNLQVRSRCLYLAHVRLTDHMPSCRVVRYLLVIHKPTQHRSKY